MPLTRSALDRMTTELLGHARENLRRDGRVAEVLMGLDANGETALMALAGGASAPEGATEAQAAGVFVAPDSLPLAGDQLEALFEERGVVAAIAFGEFWAMAGTPDALPSSGESIADHPDAEEFIYTASAWPAGRGRRLLALRIARDGDGPPDAPGRALDLTASASAAHMMWFAERLPR